MRKAAIVGLFFALLITVNGCKDEAKTTGPAESKHEALIKEGITLLNQIADTLESVQDEKTGNEAVPKLEGFLTKTQDWKKKLEAAGEPSKEEDNRLEAKYKAEMKKAQDRMTPAAASAAQKGGPTVGLKIKAAMEKIRS